MAHWDKRAAATLLGVGFIIASALGCATHAESAETGELELVVEPAVAPYDIVGRFRLTGLGVGTLDRDVVFDGVRSRRSVSLPAGRYTLTLQPGALVHCADEAHAVRDPNEHGVSPGAARLVSAPPRLLTIAPGQALSARIKLDVEAPGASAAAGGAHVACAPGVTRALSSR